MGTQNVTGFTAGGLSPSRQLPLLPAMEYGQAISPSSTESSAMLVRVNEAVAALRFDTGRAAIFACFVSHAGDVQTTTLLQIGSLRDVAFYERQVVELCFGYNLNLVIPVFYVPNGPVECPEHLIDRLNRFAQTLCFIEMAMPYVVWCQGDHIQVLATHISTGGPMPESGRR